MHLTQPGFSDSSCVPFSKHVERTQKFRQTEYSKHLYRNKLDKACFPRDAVYIDKELTNRIILDRVLKDRAYEIARNCNYDGYRRALTSTVYKFFIREQDQE